MARATVSVAATTIGPIALGISSRNMIQPSDAPIISAATAKSRSRSERISAATMRAISIQLVPAMITVIIAALGRMKAASASSRNTVGKHSTASTKRIRTMPRERP